MKAKEVFFYILGTVIVIGFFVILWVLIKTDKFPDSLNMAIGALLAAFGTVVGYFFGSSKGSADKSEILNNKP